MPTAAKEVAHEESSLNDKVESRVIPIEPKPASSIRLLGTGTDFHLVFETKRFFIGDEAAVVNEPTAVVVLSPHALKDLAVMSAIAIEAHEREFGEITTPFIQKRHAKAE